MDSDFPDHGDDFHDAGHHDDYHDPLHSDPFHHEHDDPFTHHDPLHHDDPLHIDPLHPDDHLHPDGHSAPHDTHHSDSHAPHDPAHPTPHDPAHPAPTDPKKILNDLINKAGEEIEEVEEEIEGAERTAAKKKPPINGKSKVPATGNAAEKAIEKSEGRIARFMREEKWLGKKGLVFAGAAVAIGAVIYGASKLFGKKQQKEDVMSNEPKVDNASATAAVNNILESFGKPKLNGSVEENVRRMNADPAGYKKEVDQRISAHEANGGQAAADRFIKGGRRNLSDIVADSRAGNDRTPG